MQELVLKYFIFCVTMAGLGITVAASVGALAQSWGLKTAVEGIARNPEAAGKVTVTMIIGLALIESLVIYTLVIAFMLLGKAPKLEMMIKLLGQ
ncbi:MAG: ATP synthase F0 subunit C [Desulfobacterales bacterium]|nr:ATP synthase F0 subunit C [Desulfobacterales bacterium]